MNNTVVMEAVTGQILAKVAFLWESESSCPGFGWTQLSGDYRSDRPADQFRWTQLSGDSRSDRSADQSDLVSVYSPSLERFPKETIECLSLSSFLTYLIG